MEASTRYGDLSLTDIYGELIAQCVEGRTLIEAPRGPVTVRQSGGDVRILALEGVGGDYEVVVTRPNS